MKEQQGIMDFLYEAVEHIYAFPERREGISPRQFTQLKNIEAAYEDVRIDRGRYVVGNNRPYGMTVQYKGRVIGVVYADGFVLRRGELRKDQEISVLERVIQQKVTFRSVHNF